MKSLRIILILAACFALSCDSFAQLFQEVPTSIPDLEDSDFCWGDYDNDGDLDILIAGYTGSGRITRIFRNDGADQFTELGAGLPGYRSCSVKWGDYNNDQQLDILVAGLDEFHNTSTLIYKNNGDHTFTEISENEITGTDLGEASWGDYNNDGLLDILVSGRSTEGLISRIYKNMGNDVFVCQEGITLRGMQHGTIDWVDIDVDGDLDFFYSGITDVLLPNEATSGIYINSGDNTYTELADLAIAGKSYVDSDWGDFDNDGDLDLLLAQYLYKNTLPDSLNFVEQSSTNLWSVGNCSMNWGDYDNDGWLDVIFGGRYSNTETRIYKNNGNSTFTRVQDTALAGIRDCAIGWGDYDADGDLDLLYTGKNVSYQPGTYLYKNIGSSANSVPGAPQNLQTVVTGNQVSLEWNAASDAETPASALTYNLYIGTSPSTANIVPTHANMASGYRKIVSAGAVIGTSSSIKDLSAGNYYWSVQSIDQGYAGSPFASERSFSVIQSNSIAPVEEQVLTPNQSGTTLTVSEAGSPDGRQWRYSRHAGGPYIYDIPGETSPSYTPEFPDFGTYYVVCLSKFGSQEITSNEVGIDVPRFDVETGADFPGIYTGETAWGDLNNDGYMDLVLCGRANNLNALTEVYLNNGDQTFSQEPSASLQNLYSSSVDLDDFDKDGYLDVILTGQANSNQSSIMSRIFRNNGDGTFAAYTELTVPGVYRGKSYWCDFDNNGYTDFVVCGKNINQDAITKVFYQDEIGFAEGEFFLKGGQEIAIEDINNDNFPDLFIAGYEINGITHSTLYLNNKSQGFEELINTGITPVNYCTADWGDFDGDGDPDLIISGNTTKHISTNRVTKIYQNTNNNTFTELDSQELFTVYQGTVKWGDYDNDGDLDIVMNGVSLRNGAISTIYENKGNLEFELDDNLKLTSLQSGDLSLVDYDNDTDMDILITGIHQSGTRMTILHRNNCILSNTSPSVPTNLKSNSISNGAVLSWDPAIDPETSQSSLSYNVRIGTGPGLSDVLSANYNEATSSRLVLDHGNSYLNPQFTITGLNAGTYYWSVQAIDNSYTSSAFSTEESVEVLVDFSEHSASSFTGVYYSSTAWGDIEKDGDLDLVVSGLSRYDGRITKLYVNNGSGVFSEMSQVTLEGVLYGQLDWGDYDNDGDLDLLLSGANDANERHTKVYKNCLPDSLAFHEQSQLNIAGALHNSKWIDLDNDGLLDIHLTQTNSFSTSTMYKNNGDGSFSEIMDNTIIYMDFSSCAFADYDLDGDHDLVTSGKIGEVVHTKIYSNEGDFNFEEQTDIGLAGAFDGSLDWGDFDNDGDPDILLTGADANDYPVLKIYRNDGNNTFVDLPNNVRKVRASDAKWGDYNNDGYPDIVLIGQSGNNIIRVYMNNRNESFTELDLDFRDLSYGCLDWGDYDNDGDLDFVVTGREGTLRTTIIYDNNTNFPNNQPEAPVNLSHELQGFDMNLRWSPAFDPDDPQGKVYYNLKVGTRPGGINVLSPNSDSLTGARWIPKPGNTFCDTSWIIHDIAPGQMYYWSVQAVDHSFLGGAWSVQDSFIVSEVSPDFSFDTVCLGTETSFFDLSETTDTIIRWFWDFGDGTTSTIQDPKHNFPVVDTFQVSLWVYSESGDSTEMVHEVFVKPVPDALFSVEPVCKDETSTLQNLSTLNGTVIQSWVWDFGNGESSTERSTVEKAYIQTDTATLTITADNGCWDADTQEVFIAPYPDAAISLSSGYSNIFCEGDSTIINVAYHPDYSFQWKINNINIAGSTDSVLVVKGPSGDYSVEVINPVATCISSSAIPVTMSPMPSSPTISYSRDPSAVCSGDSIMLSVPYNEGYSYEWKRDGNPIGKVSNTLYPSASGDYSLTFSNPNGCSVESAGTVTVNIVEAPLPPSISVMGSSDICEGDSVELRVSDDPELTYQWRRNNVDIPGESNAMYAAFLEGQYTIVASRSNCSTAATESIDVIVRAIPDAPSISVQEGQTSLCPDSTLRLSVVYTEGYQYTWKRNGGDIEANDTTFIYPLESGSYSVFVSNRECIVESIEPVDVHFFEKPAQPLISMEGQEAFCQGDSVVLRTSETEGLQYQWYRNDELQFDWLTPGVTIKEGGEYRLIVSNGNCSSLSSLSRTVTVHANPELLTIFVEDDTVFCGSDSARLSVPEHTSYVYEWYRTGFPLGIDAHEIFVSETGVYTLDVQNEYCETPANGAINILALEAPQRPVIQGTDETQLCTGDSAHFFYDNLQVGEEAHWYRNNVLLIDSVKEIYVFQEGDYSLVITNEIGCPSASSTSRTLEFFAPPALSQLSIGNDTVYVACPDDPWDIRITNLSMEFDYYWYHNGELVTANEDMGLHGVLAEGSYNLIVENHGCQSETRKFDLVWDDAPDKPTIISNDGPLVYYLFCDNEEADSYQWYYEGQQIPGANDYFYVANQDFGVYQVEIGENDKTCTIRSDVVRIPGGAVAVCDYELNKQLHVYPNPSQGAFHWRFASNYVGDVIIKVYSSDGKCVLNSELMKNSVIFEGQLNLNRASGIYLLTVGTGSEFARRMLVVD